MSNKNEIPMGLTHSPIVSVDYSDKDAFAGDARFLSIGRATWNKEDVSAKVWRWVDDSEKWSRQSEEIPLWRVLDLTKLIISTITGNSSSLDEKVINENDIAFLRSYINDNMELYAPRIREIEELINSSRPKSSPEKLPNIFSFATSELSQDAILAWMIKWADDKYIKEDEKLCFLGKSLVSKLTSLPLKEIHSINVGRQWRNIDIWVEINEDCFLAIEDKTGTSIHDDQLNRYRSIVEEEYRNKRNQLFFTYVKTENEPLSVENTIQSKGYKTINRQDLLSVLNGYKGNNPLVTDYREHLQEIEDKTNNYLNSLVTEWGWYEWQGFYKELEKHINVDSWAYVSNPAGGFLGLWWHFVENDEISMYLQFEESKLCFKIEYEGGENRSEIRRKYYERLMIVSQNMGVKVDKPIRFGAGTYMTIGIVPIESVFGTSPIDLIHLTHNLERFEQIVDCTIRCDL